MRKIGLCFVLLGLACGGSWAQNADDILSVRIIPSVERLQPGQPQDIALIITVKEPYHINSQAPLEDFLVPTGIAFQQAPGARYGISEFPKAETRALSFSDLPLEVYEGTFTVFCTLTLDASFPGSEVAVSGSIQYQACDDNACLPPGELEFEQLLPVARAGEPAAAANQEVFADRPPPSAAVEQTPVAAGGGMAQALNERSLLVSFLLIFLGGLALNLTPCVYPLIPITIGYFGGQAEGKRGGAVFHAVLYVLGMAITYSMLGLIAALTGSLFGAALQNPFVLIGIALVMVGLALSMFDLYEFRLPSFLTRMAGGRKKGFVGTLFMGLTVGFVAAPCIGPFVLGLLTYVGERGNVLLGFLMFFVLALGLGVPFLFLAIFSGSIDKLPRSGAWMVWVRSIFGFVLIAMAVYFLRPLFPDSLIYHLTLALILFLAGIFMAWLEPTKMPGKVFPVIRNLVGIVFFVLALVFSVSGVRAYVDAAMAEARAGAGLSAASEIHWLPGTEERLDEAVAQGKPVFIDFMADWCIPCKELDKFTFSEPEVVEMSRGFMMLKVDLTSSSDPERQRLKNRFRVKGVPTLVFLHGDGSEATELREVGFIEKDVFLEKLTKVSRIP
ncbi:MAG: protein-disulfide reductase DsbD family protein [Candidatus Aminicenantaceae bacterium]